MPWLRGGGRVGTFRADIPWDDIGSVESYLRANARWLQNTGRSTFIAGGARVAAGVDPRGSVIGEGATVTGDGLLEGCVVWPGATARSPATRTVFTTNGLTVAGQRVTVNTDATAGPLTAFGGTTNSKVYNL